MTGGTWQGPTVCVAAPSLSGHQIYQHMRVDVNGPGSWHEAESYAEHTSTELAAAEQALRKYQAHLAEGASGGSWDTAHQAGTPLLGRVQASQQRVKAYGSVAGHQAGRFTTHAHPLHDIPPDPPDAGFFSRAKTGFGLWGTDPATTKAKYQQQDQENKQQYRGYADDSATNGMDLPNPDGKTLNTTPNVRIYDPHRIPSRGAGGAAPNVGTAGGSTGTAGYGPGGAAARAGRVGPPHPAGATNAVSTPPAAADASPAGGYQPAPAPARTAPDVPAASTNTAGYDAPGYPGAPGYPDAPGYAGGGGSGAGYGRGDARFGSGLHPDPADPLNEAIPYGREGDYRWGGSAVGGGERAGGRFRWSRARGGGVSGGGYAEGGSRGEYGGARPGRGSGGSRGEYGGVRSGVGRHLGEHPPGDPAMPEGRRYPGGSAAREGGMAPMAGGAGAGGDRDRERKSPDYLRGNYLDAGTPAYDEHGFAIMPPSGLVEDWLAENGYTDR